MTPAGTSNELDVQNKWEENTVSVAFVLFLAGLGTGSYRF